MSVLVVHGHRDYSPEISSECVRRIRAAERYVASRPGVRLLVLSGAGRNAMWKSEARQMGEEWRGHEIPVIWEECSRSTAENALWVLALLGEWGVDTSELAVTTSWWHCPRAWLVWRTHGAKVRVVPSRGDWRYGARGARAVGPGDRERYPMDRKGKQMSFSVTLFGPRHYWWTVFKERSSWERRVGRVWFYRPDEHSTGGIGFCIPGLHACFTWGRER
jgi:uncharacterized SAM-binding protein YcdF (DUF218 family)